MSENVNTSLATMMPTGKPCQCYLCAMGRRVKADADSGDMERMRQSLLDLLEAYNNDTEELSVKLAYAQGILGGRSIETDQKLIWPGSWEYEKKGVK